MVQIFSARRRRVHQSALVAAVIGAMMVAAPLSASAGDLNPVPVTDHEAQVDAATPEQSAPANPSPEAEVALPSAVVDTRTIAGTIVFDARTTLEQRQDVSVGATRVSDVPELNNVPVDPANISYDPVSGAFSLVNVDAGTYKLLVRMETPSGWWFAPGVEQTVAWNGATAADLPTSQTVDVIDGDVDNLQFHFDRALGGLSIQIGRLPKPLSYDSAVVIATNVANGQEAELRFTGKCSGSASAWCLWNGVYVSGTKVTVRVVAAGVSVYYDGTPFGTTDPAKATPVEVGLWSGATLGIDPTDFVAPAAADLTDDNRGAVQVPPSAKAGAKVFVFVGKDFAGEVVRGWMYSTPALLGRAVVNPEGYAEFTLPAGVTGDHRIAIYGQLFRPWDLIGWGNISIGGAGANAAGATLASTGVAASPLVVSALLGALLIGGTLMTVAGTRRSRTH